MPKHLRGTFGVCFVWLLVGCSTPSRKPDFLQDQTEAYGCKIAWKYLHDARAEPGSLGMLDGNSVLYPNFAEEIDRRISERVGDHPLSPSERRNGVKMRRIWGALNRAEVQESISQLKLEMDFTLYGDGEADDLLTVITRVQRPVIAPEDRIGIRFIGPAIDESLDQFVLALPEVCLK